MMYSNIEISNENSTETKEKSNIKGDPNIGILAAEEASSTTLQ
jgi:hypothetical protein